MKKTLGILLAASIGMQVLCSMPVFAEEQIEEVDAGAEELVSDAWIGVEASLMDDTILLQADPEQASGFYLNLSTIALTYYAELSVGNELEATALWKDTLDYDKDGWRVPNRSAMPWERNNFRGAFELKSANGNFGIRIEVQQGRNVPY